jgi:hypothetical protein
MSLDNDLWNQLNSFFSDFDCTTLDNDQDNFRLYLDFTRQLSWDIPSALPFTPFDSDLPYKEVPMHRPADYATPTSIFYTWAELDSYYKTTHGLDLNDPSINWSFDT